METHLRLFFAIELTDKIRVELAKLIEQLHGQIPSRIIRWTALENMHITARFIGPSTPEQITSLLTNVTEALKETRQFNLQLGNLRLFPSASHARILSVTIAPSPELFQLATVIEKAVVHSGFPAEKRPYLPHLSIARFVRHPRLDLTNLPAIAVNHKVDHLTLLNSKEDAGKRIYEVIKKIEFSPKEKNKN